MLWFVLTEFVLFLHPADVDKLVGEGDVGFGPEAGGEIQAVESAHVFQRESVGDVALRRGQFVAGRF